jgi:hypothetical protein
MIHALSAKPSRDGFEHVLDGGITARFSEWDDTKVEAATIIARSAGFFASQPTLRMTCGTLRLKATSQYKRNLMSL